MCEMEVLDEGIEELLNEFEDGTGQGETDSLQIESTDSESQLVSTKGKDMSTKKSDLIPGVDLYEVGEGMHFGVIPCMTTELYDEMIGRNKDNRKISKAKVQEYRDAMLHGKWKLNGDTLQFSNKGVAISAQHRLEAWRLAHEENPRIKVPFSVSYGTRMADKSTTDCGYSQTLVHLFQRSKKANAQILGGAVRLVWLRSNSIKVSGGKALREDVARQILKDHPGIEDSCEYVSELNKEHDGGLAPILQLTYAAALHYLCLNCGDKRATKTRVNAFFEQIASGSTVEKDKSNAGEAFYKKIVKLNSGSSKVTRDGKIGLFILAFQQFLEDKSMKARWGLKEDDFPRLGGLDEEIVEEEQELPEEQEEAPTEEEAPKRRRRKKKVEEFAVGEEVKVKESGTSVWRGIIEERTEEGYVVSVKGDEDGTCFECFAEHLTKV